MIKLSWSESKKWNWSLIENPTVKTTGFGLPHALWTILNHILNEAGKYNYLLYKWRMTESPLCGCDQEKLSSI